MLTFYYSLAVEARLATQPAAGRALAIKDRHVFKSELDDEARRHMFRHTVAA